MSKGKRSENNRVRLRRWKREAAQSSGRAEWASGRVGEWTSGRSVSVKETLNGGLLGHRECHVMYIWTLSRGMLSFLFSSVTHSDSSRPLLVL